MTTRDDGLDARELRTVAWGTGAIAAFCWVMVFVVLNGEDPGPVAFMVWAVLGFTLSLAAASCAVLCGVKRTEARLGERLTAASR